ncbi:MAG: hypothetical protein ACK5JI_08585 [Azonexus sp.]
MVIAGHVEVIDRRYGAGAVEQQARLEGQGAGGGTESGFFLHGRDLSKKVDAVKILEF